MKDRNVTSDAPVKPSNQQQAWSQTEPQSQEQTTLVTAAVQLKRQQATQRRWYILVALLCLLILTLTLFVSQRQGMRLAEQQSMMIQTPTADSMQNITDPAEPESGSITVMQQLPEGSIVGPDSKTLFRFRLQSLSETGEVLRTQYRQMSFAYGFYTVDDQGYTVGTIRFDHLPKGRYRLLQMSLSEQERQGLQITTTTGVLSDHMADFWIGISPSAEELASQSQADILPSFPVYDASVTFLLQHQTAPPEEDSTRPRKVNC